LHRWKPHGDAYRCTRCDLVIRAESPDLLPLVRVHCLRGAGDWLAVRLARMGMTKRRYLAAVNWTRRRLGLAELASCGCAGRQSRLNAWSNRVLRWLR
jgi:hypothetical protein